MASERRHSLLLVPALLRWLPLAAVALVEVSSPAADTLAPSPTAEAPSGPGGPGASAPQTMIPDVVARVGDLLVTRDMVWPRIQRKVERTLAAGEGVPESLLRFLARPVVNAIIDEHLLAPKAAAAGFAPDLKRAQSHLNDLLRQDATRMGFDALLQEEGITREQYLAELALRTAITDWVRRTFVAPQEASREEAQRLYDSRRQELLAPETLRLERIVVPAAAGSASRGQAQERAAQLRRAVGAGTRFAVAPSAVGAAAGPPGAWDAARVTPKELPPEIQAALARLEAGEISPVIELPEAFAMVRWDDRVPGRQITFADVEPGLRENVKEDKGRAQFRTYLSGLRQEAKVVLYPPLEDRASAWPGLPTPAAPPLP